MSEFQRGKYLLFRFLPARVGEAKKKKSSERLMLRIWKSSRTNGWRDKCNKFTLTLTPPPRYSRKNIFGNAVKRVEIRQIYPLKRASLGLFRFP